MPIKNDKIYYEADAFAVMMILKKLAERILPDSRSREDFVRELDEVISQSLLNPDGTFRLSRTDRTEDFSRLAHGYITLFQDTIGTTGTDREVVPFGF